MLEFRFPELWKLDIYHFDYNSNIPSCILQNALAYCFEQIHVNIRPGSKSSVWEWSPSQHAGGQRYRACRSRASYPFASFSSSPLHMISLFFMTGLYVKKQLIMSCWPTVDLSDRCFHIFPPAASWTGKNHLCFYSPSGSFSMCLQDFNPLCTCYFLCPVLSPVKPLNGMHTRAWFCRSQQNHDWILHALPLHKGISQLVSACCEEFSMGNVQPPIWISATLRQVMNETSEIMVLPVSGPCNWWQSPWQDLL